MKINKRHLADQRIKLKLRAIFSALIFGVIFLLSGCAGKSVETKNSGFFKDYEGFKESGAHSSQKVLKDFEISKYKKIFIAPVEVISRIPQTELSTSQLELNRKISDYLTNGYKREIQKNAKYEVVEVMGADTLMLESAISTVEVHFDDEKWNQFSPISMDITVTSYNSYMDENVRVLGEKRIVDSLTKEVLVESMEIMKDEKIILSGEALEFENLRPALDKWLEQIKNYFAK